MKIIRLEGMEKQLATLDGAKLLFDVVRKKQVVATPEEKVRQALLHCLVHEKQFPRALLGVEVSLLVNRLKKRCDVVAYKDTMPMLIAECKSASVKIEQSTLEQAARYNLAFKVPYLLVTNGVVTLCCKLDLEKGTFSFLEEVPEHSRL